MEYSDKIAYTYINEDYNNNLLCIIEDYDKHVLNNNLKNDYCIVFYKKKDNLKFVHKIYKNIEDFKEKSIKDIAELSIIFGIDFELYIFD